MVVKQKYLVEELASRIRKRPYSLISDNCLIKSVEFARCCAKMGVEARVVPCLAVFYLHLPTGNSKVPLVSLHFYAEVLDKRYEVSHELNDEKGFGVVYNGEPKVLVRLGRFKPFIRE